MSVFETNVINIGNEAELFKSENMIILFGSNAPDDLADYCYNIELNGVKDSIQEGQTLSVGNENYIITAVGNVVEKNLKDLGHITIKFDGSNEATLAGTLYVEEKELPEISIGTEITIK